MTSPAIPAGMVTAADLYSEVGAARREIAGVAGDVRGMSAQYTAIAAIVADHETRIRASEGKIPPDLGMRLVTVERWQWKAAAVISTLAAVAGLLSGYLGFLLGHVR